MTNKQKYLDKIDELISLADTVIQSKVSTSAFPQNSSAIREFRSSVETFIVDLYGEGHPFHKNFRVAMQYEQVSRYVEAKGLLEAIRKHIAGDWLESTRNKLSVEIFDDYLEMAEYLNAEGFYIAAAVIAGSTLEERLRQLCVKHGLPIAIADKTGTLKPVKADGMNASLAQLYVDGKNDQKQVTRNYGLRNDAAHGSWNGDSAQQRQHHSIVVELMIKEVRLFINTNTL